MDAKALTQSSTFWFGVVQVLFGGVGYWFQFLDTQTAMSLILTGLGTIGFRLQTSKPITSVLPQ